jgi:hypothetical protein
MPAVALCPKLELVAPANTAATTKQTRINFIFVIIFLEKSTLSVIDRPKKSSTKNSRNHPIPQPEEIHHQPTTPGPATSIEKPPPTQNQTLRPRKNFVKPNDEMTPGTPFLNPIPKPPTRPKIPYGRARLPTSPN